MNVETTIKKVDEYLNRPRSKGSIFELSGPVDVEFVDLFYKLANLCLSDGIKCDRKTVESFFDRHATRHNRDHINALVRDRRQNIALTVRQFNDAECTRERLNVFAPLLNEIHNEIADFTFPNGVNDETFHR